MAKWKSPERRALVPAEGYYEWEKTEDGKKIPIYLPPKGMICWPSRDWV
ncbi:SOS response-associated peptidase family protein [Arthrobacter sp. NPDC093125]